MFFQELCRSKLENQKGRENCQEVAMPEARISEMKARDRKVAHSLLTTQDPSSMSQDMSCKYFSSAQRLFHVTTYVPRFVQKLKQRKSSDEP